MIETESLNGRAHALRAFSRFYTAVIGALQEGLLETPYSLTEARVLFELGRRPEMDVADLRTALGLDAGYLSRIRARLESDGLVTRGRSAGDRRRHVIGLTSRGREAFAVLDGRSAAQARSLVGRLAEDEQRALIAALATAERLLGGRARPEIQLREPGPGDMGWIIERHGALYAAEYGWDSTFEALVAGIVADFASGTDRSVERAWIATTAGARAGSVLCTRRDDATAQLRLLLVEPALRGYGLGGRLVDECLGFARAAGYGRIVLWTNDVLVDARRIYERAGFTLDEEERHTSFGHDLVGQMWSRPL
jgi:DNA-binding MarR family transcriptional regulator/N-acetylglutamate synthase-like GNAT family acetyltransferase